MYDLIWRCIVMLILIEFVLVNGTLVIGEQDIYQRKYLESCLKCEWIDLGHPVSNDGRLIKWRMHISSLSDVSPRRPRRMALKIYRRTPEKDSYLRERAFRVVKDRVIDVHEPGELVVLEDEDFEVKEGDLIGWSLLDEHKLALIPFEVDQSRSLMIAQDDTSAYGHRHAGMGEENLIFVSTAVQTFQKGVFRQLGARIYSINIEIDKNEDHDEGVVLPVEVRSDPCAICRDEFGEETIDRISCGHHFHRKCLQRARVYSSKCPLCRTEINKLN